MGRDEYRRYRDAAAVLKQVTKARAERMVRDVVNGGEAQRAQAQEWVDEMVARGRKATSDLVDVVRAEISSQLQGLGLDPEDVAHKLADILRRSAEAGRRVVRDAAEQAGAARRGPRTSTPADGDAEKGASEPAAAAKKAAPKKAGAKKAAAKKAAPKKTAATKAAAKKAAPKKAGAKKAAPKKAAATKKAAKKAGAASETPPDDDAQGTPR